jgi:single-stranded-DNA-specific exonuclease
MKYKRMNFYNEHPELPQHDIIKCILEARGVEDVHRLINVSEKDVLDPMLMLNMSKGVDLLLKHIKSNSRINILDDDDCDGYTSASVIYNYIKKKFNYTNITFTTNQNKQHGIKISRLDKIHPNQDYQLLIVPDAGTNDIKEHRILNKRGVDVLCLDHHNSTKKKFTFATVINPNQANCKYPNKHLSGVGVVYKFCQAIDNKIGVANTYADDYIDLVALGMIADSMDLRSYETRYLCLKGIEKMNQNKEIYLRGDIPNTGNPLINAFINKKKEYDLANISFYSLSWRVIPLINSCIRSGTDEEKIEMFKAFIGEGEPVMYQPKRKSKNDPKPEPIELPHEVDMIRVLTNIKSRQTKELEKAMGLIEDRIQEMSLNDNKILFVNGTEIVDNKSLTGLVAQKIASKYMKPCVILKQYDKDTFGGSFRNYSSMSVIENIQSLFHSSGFFTPDLLNMGHPNAGGIFIKSENLVLARDWLNEKLKHIDFDLVYPVDYVIPFRRLDPKVVLEIGKISSAWGNTIPTPRFAITNVKTKVEEIELIGEKANIIRIKKGDITFIKFYANADLADKMRMKNTKGFGKSPKIVVFDFIVEMEANEYEGKFYPQLNIVDFNVREIDEVLF